MCLTLCSKSVKYTMRLINIKKYYYYYKLNASQHLKSIRSQYFIGKKFKNISNKY